MKCKARSTKAVVQKDTCCFVLSLLMRAISAVFLSLRRSRQLSYPQQNSHPGGLQIRDGPSEMYSRIHPEMARGLPSHLP